MVGITEKDVCIIGGKMEKIRIELTNEEYDMLLELQDVLGHKIIDETINHILKEYINEQVTKMEKENDQNKNNRDNQR